MVLSNMELNKLTGICRQTSAVKRRRCLPLSITITIDSTQLSPRGRQLRPKLCYSNLYVPLSSNLRWFRRYFENFRCNLQHNVTLPPSENWGSVLESLLESIKGSSATVASSSRDCFGRNNNNFLRRSKLRWRNGWTRMMYHCTKHFQVAHAHAPSLLTMFFLKILS